MKRTFLIATTLIAAVGCQEIELEQAITLQDSKVFYASTEESTKTSLDNDLNVLWTRGDQVALFCANTASEQYQVTDASDGKTSATLNKVASGSFVAGTEIDANVAYYPYSSLDLTKNGSAFNLGVTLPSTQTYSSSSFGNGAFPMVAVTATTSDNTLAFKNVCGALKLQLKGTARVKTITLTGNNSEVICGTSTITAQNGVLPTIVMTGTGKTVTLNCGTGVQLDSDNATQFIIALPPTSFTSGFSVIVTDTDNKQMEITTSKSQTITRSNILRMPVVTFSGTAPDYSKVPFTITSTGSTSVSLSKNGSTYNYPFEYRKGTDDWSTYTIGTTISLADGEFVQFRNENTYKVGFSRDYNNYYYVKVTGEGTIKASGNIMSFIDRNMEAVSLNAGYPSVFSYMFKNCSKLTDASNLVLPATTLNNNAYYKMFEGCVGLEYSPTTLPAMTLCDGCYYGMFYGCSSLSTVPSLPATSLATTCYQMMFYGCSNITSAPSLPAKTMAQQCYAYMFNGCSKLAVAPSLQATTLASACYSQMFRDCTSLTNAPVLPATTLAESCYGGMFRGCTSLTAAPELPATTLSADCYGYMFMGCTKITVAPDLLATALISGCYDHMFTDCTSLKSVTAWFTTTPSTSYTNSWLSNVASAGKFYKNCTATWTNSAVTWAIPSGWTTIKDIPYVDLGLSVKWAACNVGATSPGQYGNYYQWAGTENVSSGFNRYDCPYHTGYDWDNGWTKYSWNETLELSDDAARAVMGKKWAIPSYSNWEELKNTSNCTWTWTTQNGNNGYLITSKKNGNSLFLPAAGSRESSSLIDAGTYGHYWTNEVGKFVDYDYGPQSSFQLWFYSSTIGISESGRDHGLSVRAIWN